MLQKARGKQQHQELQQSQQPICALGQAPYQQRQVVPSGA